MSGYLLDATALSAYYLQTHLHHAAAKRVIDQLPTNAYRFVSAITLAEIDYGVRLAEAKGKQILPHMRERLETIRQYARLETTHHTSGAYAELKCLLAQRMLRRRGKMPRYLEDWIDEGSGKRLQLDENDLWLSAQAKERDITLITCDRDFQRFADVDGDIRLIFALE